MSKFRSLSLIVIGLSLHFMYSNCAGKSSELDQSVLASSGSCGEGLPIETRSPTNIDQVVTLINSLPKPLTLDCFLRSLQRPLSVFSSNSPSSVQPAFDNENPRIFIFSKKLILAVVPKGSSKYLLEMSYKTDSISSVKAELLFPIQGPISSSEPYSRILEGSFGTSCKTCHTNEGIYSGVPGGKAYVSKYIEALPETQITQPYMYAKALYCNTASDPYRCNILRSIFLDGQAKDGFFP